MASLSSEQIAFYREQGYLVLSGLFQASEVSEMRQETARVLEGARGLASHTDVFDLEDSHRPDAPRVRRIKMPHRVSELFGRIIRDERILAPVRDLCGPSLRLHTTKMNLKSAGYGAPVEWHQDWAFYPHTNDDILAVGLMLDDMTEDNGPLLVLPGTHRGPTWDHHADGHFCGAMDPYACDLDFSKAVKLTGPAGSISLHHVRLVHGSATNTSGADRRLMLYEVSAADAWPLAGTSSPFTDLDEFDSRLLCGEPTIVPRLVDAPIRIPQPRAKLAGSIYENQKGARRTWFAERGKAPARELESAD
jgi:ectoine hydroxylase-related dioxygenase (phytanoyl-CoA dioxygenase family)